MPWCCNAFVSQCLDAVPQCINASVPQKKSPRCLGASITWRLSMPCSTSMLVPCCLNASGPSVRSVPQCFVAPRPWCLNQGLVASMPRCDQCLNALLPQDLGASMPQCKSATCSCHAVPYRGVSLDQPLERPGWAQRSSTACHP